MVKLKKNGLSQADKVDSMNLLDTSDSDVEWLNLPPLKGKKPTKRKKAAVKTREAGCSLSSLVKPVFYVTLLGAIVLLVITTVWLTAQVSDLRARLHKLETKSVGNIEDIQKLYSQLSTCNKSLEAETKQLAAVQANVSSINSTISKLTEDVARVGASLKSAPELKQLPDKLQTVSKTVADLGSDVTGMKDTVTGLQTSVKQADTKLQELTTQLELLKQTTDSDGGSDNELSPELANQIQTIQQKLGDVNSTLSTKVSVMMKSLGQHEDRFTQLDDVTETLRRNLTSLGADHTSISGEHAGMAEVLTSDEFKTSVQDIVNNALSQRNHTEVTTNPGSASPTTRPPSSSSSSSSVSSILISVKDTIDMIQERYHNLSITVQKNTGDIEDMKVSFVPLPRFNTVRDEFQTTLTTLNATLMTLKAQVDKTPVPVTSAPEPTTKKQTQAPNSTIQSQPTTKAQATDTAAPAVNTTVKLPATAGQGESGTPSIKKPTPPNTGTVSTKEPDAENPQTGSTGNTEKPVLTPKPDTGPHLGIGGIETADDLDLNFRRWDSTGEGQVPYNRLEDFLGPKRPAESELKPYDKDNNDLYSIEEFAKALGITLEDDMANPKQDAKTGREG